MHAYRTHTCAQLSAKNVGETVRLSGWMHRKRDHGGVLFVDLRDHYGITQLVARPGTEAYEALDKLSKETVVRVDGQVTFNNSYAMIDAAVSGLGIAYVPEDIVASRISSGALELVLDDWSPLFDGYFLYYPSRRQNLAAFQIVVDALRYRKS